MGDLIEFPDVKQSREKIRRLKNDLEALLLEREHLRSVICVNIQREYTLVFGGLEYQIYKASCDYLRLRRKKELIQAKKNRRERIDLKAVEARLDEEFRDYKKKLDEKMAEVNRALKASAMEFLSEEETKAIKKLYKQLVKRLHPDLNPSSTEAEIELFYRATEAYKRGDLKALQLIDAVVDDGERKDDEAFSSGVVEKEAERLEGLIEAVQKDMEAIKSGPPYTWRIYLEDEKKKAERLRQLKEELANFKTAIKTQEESINDLMGDER